MTRARRLVVDRIACEGRGLCFELLPELIESDDWGFPILAPGDVPDRLLPAARRAVSACPVLALRIVADHGPPRAHAGEGASGTASRARPRRARRRT